MIYDHYVVPSLCFPPFTSQSTTQYVLYLELSREARLQLCESPEPRFFPDDSKSAEAFATSEPSCECPEAGGVAFMKAQTSLLLQKRCSSKKREWLRMKLFSRALIYETLSSMVVLSLAVS